MPVYKGEQSFQDWIALQAQGRLFKPFETDRAVVQKRLDVLAVRVVLDLGRDVDDFELRHVIKDRFAGKGDYDSGMVARALDAALRQRKRL